MALGLGYLLVVLTHAMLHARVNKHSWRIAPFNVTSALLVMAAGFTSGAAEYALWIAAGAAEVIGHPGSGGLPAALALGIGPAAFISGTAAFRAAQDAGRAGH